MVKEIIKYIYEKGDFSAEGIGRALNISVEMADIYKEKLEILGYIEKEKNCTPSMCKKCCCGCNSKSLNSITQWNFTEKGLLVARKNF